MFVKRQTQQLAQIQGHNPPTKQLSFFIYQAKAKLSQLKYLLCLTMLKTKFLIKMYVDLIIAKMPLQHCFCWRQR